MCQLFYWLGGYLSRKESIKGDITRWRNLGKVHFANDFFALLELLNSYKEFRNIFYLRYRPLRHLRLLMPPLSSLYINTEDIGQGLFFQHGFSSVVSAKSIGKNCWINQQVTIGHTAQGAPVIGDNVRIGAGAIVIGNIKIGNNVTIAAGATVNIDVPDNSLVVPQKARIIENHIESKQ
jgi:serine O-acetyltransferase